MIRAQFRVYDYTFHPAGFQTDHPYWCVEEGKDYYDMYAYADDGEDLKKRWPNAVNIKISPAKKYEFSSDFPKPLWFKDSNEVLQM